MSAPHVPELFAGQPVRQRFRGVLRHRSGSSGSSGVMFVAPVVEPAANKAAAAERLAAEARVNQRTLEKQLEAANAAVEAAEVEARRLEDEVRFSI